MAAIPTAGHSVLALLSPEEKRESQRKPTPTFTPTITNKAEVAIIK